MNSEPTIEEIKFLKLVKYRCNNSTLDFTRYFFKKQYGKRFVIGEHHRLISEALDKVISGEIKKLMINIAPRYGKTELAIKNFIAHGLAINPASKFIHLSYSDDLALDNSEGVKDIIKHESYQQLYGNEVVIKQNSDSKKKWYTTASGGVYATGAGGQVTGFGAGVVDDIDDDYFAVTGKNKIFAGALLIDDPIKPDDADSELKRERVNTKYDSTIKNRVNSRNTPIVVVMQRVHERDLCGYLLENEPGEWVVLSLPCIREDGTVLWEHKHTMTELLKLKEANEVVFERQYQQDPKPLKGLCFPKDSLNYFIPSPEIEKTYESSNGYIDVADEGSDSLSACVGRNSGTRIYVPDIVFNKSNADITKTLCAQWIKRNAINYTRVESNNMGAIFGRDLQKLVPNSAIRLINNSTNKHTRIIQQADFIIKNFWFVHPDYQTNEYKAFMKELCSYQKEVKTQVHDDAPDSLSGLCMFIRQTLAHLFR